MVDAVALGQTRKLQRSLPNRRQITTRCGFPTAAYALNNGTSQYIQVQQKIGFEVMEPCTDIAVTWGNFQSAGTATTNFDGPSAITVRAGITDGTNAIPLLFTGGAAGGRDGTIEPGDIRHTRPMKPYLFVPKVRYYLTYLITCAAVWPSLPALRTPCNSSYEGAEASATANLTDRTLSTNWFPTGPLNSNGCPYFAPLAITASGNSRTARVAIFGDSITCDAANAALNYGLGMGWAQNGLIRAGIPYLTCGESGANGVTIAGNKLSYRDRLAVLADAGITHVFYTLGSNDSGAGATAPQMYAAAQTIAEMVTRQGMKTVLNTLGPRTTDGTNTTPVNPQSRIDYNSLVYFSRGVGDGYFDYSPLCRDAVNTNLWRTDMQEVSGITLAGGGAGYNANEWVIFGREVVAQISAVSGGVVTTIGGPVSKGWGLAGALPNSLTQRYSYRTLAGTAGGGSGLSVTPTWSTPAPTTDGVHPNNALHCYVADQFAAAAPSLFV